MTQPRTPLEEDLLRQIKDLQIRMGKIETAAVLQQVAPSVIKNGTALPKPVIMASAAVVTSTGSLGTYALNFPSSFAVAPVVVAWSGVPSGGNFSEISLAGVTTSGFTFYIQEFNPGQAAVPAGQTLVISWIAIGS